MSKSRLWVYRGLSVLSVLLAAFVTVCYAGRYDWCEAVTVFPVWCWLLPGLVILLVALRCRRGVWVYAPAALWLVFLAVFADTPTSLIRAWLPAPTEQATLRVVSLNCATEATAVREVASLRPDVVLFQESPGREVVAKLADELYGPGGHTHWMCDTSIIARGEVDIVDVPRPFRQNFVHVRVQHDGRTIDVISLRLLPCPVRLDLWSADCWRTYRGNHVKRRNQLQTIANYVAMLPAGATIILGGDFNAPAGDGVFRLLQPRLADSFRAAGRGWGATFMSHLPVVRIDQIWTTADVRPLAVTARESRYSDHRMVAADFAMQQSTE